MTKSRLWNSEQRFGVVAQWLHWGMFALIALQLVGGHVLEELPKRTAIRGFAFDAHETLGLIALFLVFLRLSWKMANPTPAAPGQRWQQLAMRAAHLALYVLMIAVPVVGYLMVDAKGYDVAFFGWAAPDLVATDKDLAERLNGLGRAPQRPARDTGVGIDGDRGGPRRRGRLAPGRASRRHDEPDASRDARVVA